MRKYFLILLLLISASGYSQAPNIIYGKDVIIQTRDTSSAELTIKNSTRNVLGYFKNVGGGKGQYTLIPQVDITGLPDSLLYRYTKAQADARYKPISYIPDWLELTGVPSNFSTTYALSNDIQDSLLNKVSRSGTYADPSFISSLSWSKLTGVPALITLADSTTILAGRWLPNRSADTAAALQARIQTKSTLEGSTAITTVGTIGTGTWQASPIADAYISSAATWNAKQNALGFTPENLANKGVANGYADLDALGKIPASRIDFTQTGQTFVVASQAAMLAISGANVGAIAIRTDENKNYRLIGLPASTLSNWLALLTPDAPVQSVNGFTGNVNLLTTHITEGSNYYWTAARSRAAQSLTTTGNSGAASYDNSSGVLNVPTYTLAGLGGQPALSGTGFVKISGTTISYDNSTYLTSFTETDPTLYSWAKAASKPSYSWGDITGTVPVWNQNTTGTAANATAWNSQNFTGGTDASFSYLLGSDGTGIWQAKSATSVKSFLGLDSYAYRSSGLAELSGAAFTGGITGTTVSFSGNGAFGSLSVSSGGAFFGGSALMGNGLYGIRNNDNTVGYGAFGRSGLIEGNSNTEIGIFSETGFNVYTGGSGAVKARFNPDGSLNAGNIGGVTNKIGTFNMGLSSGGYAAVGYNIRYTTSSGIYQYDVTDVSWMLDLGNYGQFRLRYAPSGTAGTSISYTDFITVSNTGAITASSNVTAGGTISSPYNVVGNDTDGKYETGANSTASGWYLYKTGSGYQLYVNKTTGLFTVVNSASIGGGLTVGGGIAATGIVSVYSTTASTSTTTGALVVGGGFGAAGAIYAGGNITAPAFYESSDIRQKTVHKTVTSADGINAIQYTFKPSGQDKWGYSAQQVQTVLPYAVNKADDGFFKVDYTTVHTYKIAQLEQRIAELEKQLIK